jgi:hypothetical protein
LHQLVISRLESATQLVFIVVTLRALPIVVSISASEACRWTDRVVAVSAYTAIGWLAIRFANYDAIGMMAAYAYLTAIAVVPYMVSKAMRSRLAVFTSAAAVFLVVPAALSAAPTVVALVLGWEFTLASYSYCASVGTAASLKEYMSFVVVNPALAYPRRGEVVAAVGLDRMGFGRVLLGSLMTFLSAVVPLFAELPSEVFQRDVPAALDLTVIAQLYCAHTGLASIQIGLCRQIGIALPERYLKPWAAASPADFWRRWNTYVGTWIKLHVFLPITRFASRRLGLRGRALQTFSLVVSFACVGALHDLYRSLSQHSFRYEWAIWFAANGLIVVVWEALDRTSALESVASSFRQIGGRVLVLVIAVGMAASLP